MCVKIFYFKSVHFGQPVSENSVFRTTYINKHDILQCMALSWGKLTEMSDDINNVIRMRFNDHVLVRIYSQAPTACMQTLLSNSS